MSAPGRPKGEYRKAKPEGTPVNEAQRVPPHIARVAAFYETLTRASLAELATVYAAQARFVDPFNDVRGHAALRAVFEHMFDALDAPRFEIVDALGDAGQGFLTWNFSFRRHAQRATLTIHGASHLRFDAEGRVTLHRDYWDAAHQVYERVPLLGAVLRGLRRRLGAPAGGAR